VRTPVAIEIGEKWLKLVGLRPSQIQPFLYYKIKPLTGLADEQIAAMINDILQRLKIKPTSIVISFPRNRVTVRNLHLPSQDTQEIIQMIDLNTVRIVPYHKEEIISSYQTLGTDEIGYAKIILAIIHKNSAERLLQTLEKAGLFIDKIFLSSYGAREWVLFNHKSEIKPNQAYLLLDVDSEFTDFIIFDSENLLFTRSITIGSGELTKHNEITKFIGEVRQSLVIFQNEERGRNLAKLFLSGAAGKIDNLGTLLSEELEMPIVTTPSPFAHEKFKISDKEANDTVSLSALTSFLLKEDSKRITFHLPEIQIRQALKEKTKKLVILGSLGIYLLALICGIFLGRIYNNQSHLKKIKRMNSSIELDIE